MFKGGGGAGADRLNLERLAEATAFLRGLNFALAVTGGDQHVLSREVTWSSSCFGGLTWVTAWRVGRKSGRERVQGEQLCVREEGKGRLNWGNQRRRGTGASVRWV